MPELVDLGLSVKWSNCNLGADNPWDSGLYYQWGDTQGYGFDTSDGKCFGWSDDEDNITYKWSNGSYNTLTRYVPSNKASSYGYNGFYDNMTAIGPEDDAAHSALGDNWRMPTDAEWAELHNNCTWEWTSNYNSTGVYGRIVTSKKEGYKDKSIFLPAAGYRSYGNLFNVVSFGYYWSSSLNTDSPDYAYYMYFGSTSLSRLYGSRYRGQSVRPVSE